MLKSCAQVVILCGGVGSRLWPSSTPSSPKIFTSLPNGETLLSHTLRRAAQFSPSPLIVSSKALYSDLRYEVASAGVSCAYILESSARGTAIAVAYSAYYAIAKHGLDTIVVVMPADHLITNEEGFESSVAHAVDLAKEGYLVTLGITPNYPSTGFGYIEFGEALNYGFKAKKFIEKPNVETAKKFVDSGRFLWNSGIFCFKARVYLDELRLHAPDIAAVVASVWNDLTHSEAHDVTLLPEIFGHCFSDVSIDHAVMEKSDRVAVVPANFEWSDIGSWESYKNLLEPDQNQNRAVGDAFFLDTRNTFVHGSNRLVSTLGVQDLIIVDAPNAILVAHVDKAQDVKKLVSFLPQSVLNSLNSTRTVIRPWGTYTVIETGPGFKIKKIEVMPGGSLSLQMHQHRSEHWVVVSGSAKITSGDSESTLIANQSTYIPAGEKHRLENPCSEPCIMIEVQCGEYLEEDDIVRFEDTYGRN